MGSERSIYSGNKMSSHVEAVGTCSLILNSGYILQLKKTFYIPEYSRNLISVSRLVSNGYSFNFSDSGFNLFYKSDIIGYDTLSDGLFLLSLRNDDNHTIMHVHEKIGTKRYVVNEESSMLWHQRLGHISIDRIKRLVNDGVLSTLDFIDFETCIGCIKGK